MRPKKNIVVKRNNDSFQVYENGMYIGSISVRRLCQLIKAEKRLSTTDEEAQKNAIDRTSKIYRSGTILERYSNG